jgi:hypothetical protein
MTMDDFSDISNRHEENREDMDVIYIFISLGLSLALISIICGSIIYCNIGGCNRRRMRRRYISQEDDPCLSRRRESAV